MLEMHARTQAVEDLGRRFVECFVQALDDAGLPDDVEFRAALRGYMEWQVAAVMAVSPEDAVVQHRLAAPSRPSASDPIG